MRKNVVLHAISMLHDIIFERLHAHLLQQFTPILCTIFIAS